MISKTLSLTGLTPNESLTGYSMSVPCVLKLSNERKKVIQHLFCSPDLNLFIQNSQNNVPMIDTIEHFNTIDPKTGNYYIVFNVKFYEDYEYKLYNNNYISSKLISTRYISFKVVFIFFLIFFLNIFSSKIFLIFFFNIFLKYFFSIFFFLNLVL